MFKEKFLINQLGGGNKAFDLLSKALQSAQQKKTEQEAGAPFETPEAPAGIPESLIETPNYKAVFNEYFFGTPEIPTDLVDWRTWQGGGVLGKWIPMLTSPEQSDAFREDLSQKIVDLQNSYESIESFTDEELRDFIAKLENVGESARA